MKKLILPLLFILILPSCSLTEKAEILPDFSVNGYFTVKYMQSEYGAEIKTDENGNLTADIQSPENLKGISVVCTQNGVLAKCGELEISSTDGYYPFSELYKALSSAKNSEPVSVTEKENGFAFSYPDGCAFTTDESGTIKYIFTPLCEYVKR